MKARTTQVLLAAVVLLLTVHLVRYAQPMAEAQEGERIPTVLRAQAIELVDQQGRVVAQLYVGDDGGGNLRLRSGDGTVRVKLGATSDGSGLLLLDKDAEPAVSLMTKKDGTSITLAEKGKNSRVIEP
jgi:hypothetical protein